MFGLRWTEILILVALVFLVVGPVRLRRIATRIGESLRGRQGTLPPRKTPRGGRSDRGL